MACGAKGRGFKSLRARHSPSSAAFRNFPGAKPTEKANAHQLAEAVETFLLTKRAAGCTPATMRTYLWWLDRFTDAVSEISPLAVRTFFVGLQSRSTSHQHQGFRVLRTFFRWCVETGVLTDIPLRGFSMRTPKTLPQVPTDDELCPFLLQCSLARA